MAVRSTLRADRPPFIPRKIPDNHFCYRLSRPKGHSAAGRIRLIEKKSNDLIGIRTRDLPPCSIVPQPTTLPSAPFCVTCPVHRADFHLTVLTKVCDDGTLVQLLCF
jgi:hypothetical protein